MVVRRKKCLECLITEGKEGKFLFKKVPPSILFEIKSTPNSTEVCSAKNFNQHTCKVKLTMTGTNYNTQRNKRWGGAWVLSTPFGSVKFGMISMLMCKKIVLKCNKLDQGHPTFFPPTRRQSQNKRNQVH